MQKGPEKTPIAPVMPEAYQHDYDENQVCKKCQLPMLRLKYKICAPTV